MRLSGVSNLRTNAFPNFNKILAILFFALLIFGAALPAFAQTTYYVDPNYTGGGSNGSPTNPWTSIQWSNVNSALASANVTVYFSACNATCTTANTSGPLILSRTDTGTHLLTLDGSSFFNSNANTAGAPTWTVNAVQAPCTGFECAKTASWMRAKKFNITGTYTLQKTTGPNDRNCTIGHITVQGFLVSNSGGHTAAPTDMNNITLQYSEFTRTAVGDSVGPTIDMGTGNSGPCTSGNSDNYTVQYNYIHAGWGEGIYVGASTSDNMPQQPTEYPNEGLTCQTNCPTGANYLIAYNTIESTASWGGQGDGIDVKDGHVNLTIRGNTIWTTLACTNCGTANGGPGRGGAMGIVAESGSLFEGNFINAPEVNGIVITDSWDNQLGRNTITIRNNIITNVLGNNGIWIGQGGSGTCSATPAFPFTFASFPCWSSATVYNNTIYNTAPGGGCIEADGNDAVLNGAVTVQNNICHTTGGITGAIATKDHNLCFNGTTGCTGTGTLTSDPKFISTTVPPDTNLQLQGASPALGAGVNLSGTGFNNDYFGKSRPTNWAMGAAESTSAPTPVPPVSASPASITATGGASQSTTVNTAFGTPLTATVKDASNNLLSGVTVTFTAPASGAGGTFTGGLTTATATTNTSGVATAPAFTANGTAGTYAVTATVSGVGTPATFNLTNRALTPLPAVTPATSQIPFNFPNLGATSIISGGTSGVLAVGDAAIQVTPGSATPSGVAIFGLRETGVPGFADTGVLVTEAGVPAISLIRTGRVYVQVTGVRNTGIAMANPGVQDAVVSFSFTDTNGNTFGTGSTTVLAGQQIAKFLNEPPFNSGNSVEGTFTFSSSVPVTVIALRTFVNERGDFLVTTLPVADLSAAVASSMVVLPQFADGGGWVTSVILVNPTANPLVGTIQFLGPSGSPLTLTSGGKNNSTFNYTIAGNNSFRLVTTGSGSTTKSGSVRVVPGSNTAAPIGLAVYSYSPAGITVTEAGVPSISGTAFRAYVQTSSTPGAVIQSGLAMANVSTSPATVNLQLFNPDGTTAAASTSLTLPGSGQIAKYLTDLFPNLPQPFQGVVRISTASSNLAVAGLRTRYNERGDYLITTTLPASESATPGQLFFPDLAIGGGYSTQLILFSGSPGSSSSGTLNFFSQSGAPWAITAQ